MLKFKPKYVLKPWGGDRIRDLLGRSDTPEGALASLGNWLTSKNTNLSSLKVTERGRPSVNCGAMEFWVARLKGYFLFFLNG